MSRRAELRDGVHVVELMPSHHGDSTFLLLHGLGGTLRFWSGVAPALGAVGRTLVIDVPGFGRSALPGDQVTLDGVADAIIEFCHRAKATRCTVVAHSLSGMVALRVAAKNPGVCRRLVLVDATPVTGIEMLHHPARALRAPALAATLAAQFAGGLVPLRPWSAGLIARSKVLRSIALGAFVAEPSRLDPVLTAEALSYTGGARTVLRALRQARGIDLPALLDAARVPIDVVRGERDTMNTAADFEIVRRHADVRRELIVRNCRHWPLIEDPQALVDFILAKE
ncbi:alpha/beta fold hydrolase [Amycolatopsis sp. lyj-109]|uniref:alpha/beta fold hydrolase n=1 Tax=Amycolatopsis sp. lyj-109 TaxID=2789287 RepID=UPI00397DD308